MRIGMRTIKTAVGACIAIWIANWLSLDYAVSAGVITILSIQNTKKKLFTASVSAIILSNPCPSGCSALFLRDRL